MSRVSYQSFLDDESGPGRNASFRPLGEADVATRRKDARRELTVAISKRQARWLREMDEISGRGVDADALVRAMLDLAAQLDVDWALMAGGASVRAAVRTAVLVRQPAAGSSSPDAP